MAIVANPEIQIYPILQAEEIALKKIQDRQRGRLIAKVIAVTRHPKMDHNIHSERGEILIKLSDYRPDHSFSRFIAKLDENPFANQRRLVRACFGGK